jgi:hypothetical protein
LIELYIKMGKLIKLYIKTYKWDCKKIGKLNLTNETIYKDRWINVIIYKDTKDE